MKYSYEITPRPAAQGGGWRLRLLEDGEEMDSGDFPVALDNPQAGVICWNACTEPDRAYWMDVAKSAVPADAWIACQFAEAHADAENAAYKWLDSRENV